MHWVIMTLPTKAKQIAAVAALLEKAAEHAGLSLEDVAALIVEGYHDILLSPKTGIQPHVGMAFKHPSSSTVLHVAWMDEGEAWIVSGASRYGFFMYPDSDYWKFAEPSTAKAGAPGNNPKWEVGQLVTRSQRSKTFEVMATADKCVLLQDVNNGRICAESNDCMELYYKKTTKPVEVDW